MSIFHNAPSFVISHFSPYLNDIDVPACLVDQHQIIFSNQQAQRLIQPLLSANDLNRSDLCLSSKSPLCIERFKQAQKEDSCYFQWQVNATSRSSVLLQVHPIYLNIANLYLAYISPFIDEQQSQAESLKHQLITNIQGAVMLTNHNNLIMYVNKAFESLTGYSKSEAIGRPAGFMKSGKHSQEFYRQMWEQLNTSGFWQGEIWDKHKLGQVYAKTVTISVLNKFNMKTKQFLATFTECGNSKVYGFN